jgi:hypothetical protein
MVHYYSVQTPDGAALLWMGGLLQRSSVGCNVVWLTTPAGKPLWWVTEDCVKPLTREQAAELLLAQRKAAS